jgi:hypothetical protein
MSSDRWRWAQQAQELRFHQLEAARKQAETWRAGLTGLTALFGAVLIVKGRDNLTDLSSPYQQVVVVLLGLALVALVVATLAALRAASGTPGDECLLTGEDLEAWTRHEVVEVQRTVVLARRLTLVGACTLAIAIGLAWLAPVRTAREPLVIVEFGGGRICGDLSGISNGTVVVRVTEQYRIIPLASVTRMDSAKSCPT